MRRLLAILLLAAFGLPVAAPLLAQGQDPQRKLPACCRRTGAHHCLMDAAQRGNSPAIGARCPSFPHAATTAPQAKPFALLTLFTRTNAPTATEAVAARAATQRRLSRERARHKRGPPAALLAA